MEKQYITVSVHKNPDTGLLEIDEEETQKRLKELSERSSYFDKKVKEIVNELEDCVDWQIDFNHPLFYKWLKKELIAISLDAIHDSEIQTEAFNCSKGF